MGPVGYAGVGAFLDWLRRMRPEVRSLKSLSKEEFMNLATAYEKSKGHNIKKSDRAYLSWDSTKYVIDMHPSDDEALQDLRKMGG